MTSIRDKSSLSRTNDCAVSHGSLTFMHGGTKIPISRIREARDRLKGVHMHSKQATNGINVKAALETSISSLAEPERRPDNSKTDLVRPKGFFS